MEGERNRDKEVGCVQDIILCSSFPLQKRAISAEATIVKLKQEISSLQVSISLHP